eukprot:148182-Rhodomonas_salina.1
MRSGREMAAMCWLHTFCRRPLPASLLTGGRSPQGSESEGGRGSERKREGGQAEKGEEREKGEKERDC